MVVSSSLLAFSAAVRASLASLLALRSASLEADKLCFVVSRSEVSVLIFSATINWLTAKAAMPAKIAMIKEILTILFSFKV